MTDIQKITDNRLTIFRFISQNLICLNEKQILKIHGYIVFCLFNIFLTWCSQKWSKISCLTQSSRFVNQLRCLTNCLNTIQFGFRNRAHQVQIKQHMTFLQSRWINCQIQFPDILRTPHTSICLLYSTHKMSEMKILTPIVQKHKQTGSRMTRD